MKPFDYMVADEPGAALDVYADGKAELKAGGVDLLDLMKERILSPDTVLSIERVREWAYIRADGDGVRIGSLTTLASIAESAVLKQAFPGLVEAAEGAATPQIRERATLGGNLCQRPRCWYYRNEEFPCLKKRGSTCFAVDGENEYHAIFGGGPCHIVHPSHMAVPLVAVDARLTLRSRAGERVVPAREFFVLPHRSLYRENVLREDEILVEIHVPTCPSHSATVEVREKQSFDWPLAMASVARVEGRWHVCLGAVAPVPWLSRQAGEALGAEDLTPERAEAAGDAAVTGANPMAQNQYKVQLARVVVKRALMAAAGTEERA